MANEAQKTKTSSGQKSSTVLWLEFFASPTL